MFRLNVNHSFIRLLFSVVCIAIDALVIVNKLRLVLFSFSDRDAKVRESLHQSIIVTRDISFVNS